MVVVRVKGGLGNQLFQYATGYAVARKMNTELCVEKSFYPMQKLRGFKLSLLTISESEIKNEICRPLFVQVFENRYINKLLRIAGFEKMTFLNQTYFLETKLKYLPQIFELSSDRVYLDGYFQSYMYFEQYREDLLKLFVPRYEFNEEWKSYCREMCQVDSVAVHVRRGDYLKIKNKNDLQYVLEEDYYKRAIDFLAGKLSNPVFYWFSDDIEWVKEHFGENSRFKYVRLTSENADLDEMMLMSNCKSIITANSSFSWWAAWLNQNKKAIVIAPKKRFGNENMIPNNWIKM